MNAQPRKKRIRGNTEHLVYMGTWVSAETRDKFKRLAQADERPMAVVLKRLIEKTVNQPET